MKIAIDIRCLQTDSRFRGIGYYTYNLLLNILSLDKSNEYFLLAFNDKIDFDIPSKNFCYLPYLKNLRRLGYLRDLFFLNKELENYKFDLVHFTSPFETLFGFCLKKKTSFKKIVTLHDLTPLYFAKRIFTGHRAFLKPLYLSFLKDVTYADKIIAVSQNTSYDLKTKLHIPQEKINIIYEGVNEVFFQNTTEENIKKIKEKYHLPSEFLLYVGGFNLNKNMVLLFNAVKKLKIPLVFAGRRRKEDIKFLSEHTKGIENLIYFLDFMPDCELPCLYKASKIFVFPSFYEGFGLPPLEALASGMPVISSNTSSLPEVIGNAGVLIDPTDEQKWVKEILNLWNNDSLRKELSQKGLAQAKKFSWEQAARKTIAAYENT